MKLIMTVALLLPLTAAAPPAEPAKPAPVPSARVAADMPNFSAGRPDCPSFARQIAEETKAWRERALEARTLNREPPAHLLLAVDRHENGCHKLTFVRRNIAPGTAMPKAGRRD